MTPTVKERGGRNLGFSREAIAITAIRDVIFYIILMESLLWGTTRLF